MDPGAGGSVSAPPPPATSPGVEAKEVVKSGGKQVVVVLVGPPGSGKSTFAEAVLGGSAACRPWVRVCQDIIGNGKAGTKIQCLKALADALKEGKSVLIDRCNLERKQRADFVKLGSTMHADVHAIALDLPAKVCISRAVSRTGHEGNLQGGKAALVVNRMLQKKETPLLTEGFSRIMFCNDDGDIKKAVDMYNGLGPLDSLASGVFGQKSKGPIQIGIMKFLKKAGTSSVEKSSGPKLTFSERKPGQQNPLPEQEKVEAGFACSMEVKELNVKKENEGQAKESSANDIGSHTLAFPSISTADFQFDLDRASDIIVETAADFLQKFDNIRLVLVDLSKKSRILSLVKDKAAKKSIDSRRFFTFVGDITQLRSKGGLQCNVIANAANWRLKPGGGGVNAAIFDAAGEALQHATKECADTLRPGSSVVVPVPLTSPLHQWEGVTHVIHVLGPNMNPMRPDYLKNDYTEGCKILHEAYNSLFENFASVVQSDMMGNQNNGCIADKSASGATTPSDSKMKREDSHESVRMKKHKLLQPILTSKQQHKCPGANAPNYHENSMGSSDAPNQATEADNKKSGVVASKSWGSWAQALYELAMHPEKYKNSDSILEISSEFVVLKDLYPKAKKHVLVISRTNGLDSLADAKKEHLPLLRRMYSTGVKWAQKFLEEDASLVFRLGYHSVPSMRQLHLHIISQDFNSASLKNKKHWNSFTTVFFRDSVDVIEEIEQHGSAITSSDDKVLAMELRCHRCRSAHPNIPKLKSHIANCKSPFPSHLLQKNRLLLSSTMHTDCS
ncbi:transcription factor bHLH140 [Phragmites australis]|uniref:transcription factor bHLH140 n=1 Tax=Phragmites australis TaxID=29695 RepID=UPI002D78ADC4|nr:transcription factor bHLH140 [Phragmites australis]